MEKKKLKHKKLIITLSVVGTILIACVATFFIYVSIYYKATDRALKMSCEDGEGYTLEWPRGKDIAFVPEEPEVGLLFYPGGKVEHKAYSPLMAEFAKRGVLCILMDMPFELAIFDINAADGLREKYPNITSWYVGGHSLGGAMSASYLGKHIGEYDGLLLLGAYSTVDFSGTDMTVVSVYGSEDGVMNRQKYSHNKSNLPADFAELVIEGGCHAYFGDYGAQSGDGTPTITPEHQWSITADFFVNSICK